MRNFKEDFDLVHEIVPGKHFYQFYKSPEDLFRILVNYWEAGVQKKDFCFWALPVHLSIEEAKAILKPTIPELDELLFKGSFEIVLHQDWYGDGETFDGELVVAKYIGKMKEAIANGFSVIRVAGDTTGFKPHLWNTLQEYERRSQESIHMLPCIALCSYPIHSLRLQQTKDVLDHHHAVLVAKV